MFLSHGMERDYYEVLGVHRSATPREVKRAFRRLVKELHPDRHGGDPEKEARFKEVAEAYAVIGDPEQRTLYDQFGEVGVRSGDEGVKFDFESVMSGLGGLGIDFEEFFGSGRTRRRRGRDVVLSVRVGMLDALRGCEQMVNYRSDRGGQGEQVRVRIPPGSRSGDNLRVRGKGRNGRRGGGTGDLKIRLEVVPHPSLRWEGDAVVMELPLTCLEAYRGARVEIQTPSGAVRVRIPPGSRTGQKLRLRGKGPTRRGQPVDLILRLAVHLPEGEDDLVVQALEKVEAAYGECPRSKLPFLGS